MKKKNLAGGLAALTVLAPVWSASAAIVAVDCAKKGSINVALSKLDRSVPNTVNVSGTCAENVVISGHRDLTIAAVGTAGLQPADSTASTVLISGSSRATLQGLSIVAGGYGVYCDDRSVCILRNVAIDGGAYGGLALQKQSSGDVQGSTITGSQSIGVGVYGASSVNIGDDAAGTHTTISGHTSGSPYYSGFGLFAQDGSFARTDFATISNNDTGASGDRGAVLKLLGSQLVGNRNHGVVVRASTLQVSGNFSNNGGDGIRVRRLGYLTFAGPTEATGNGVYSIRCEHVTAITFPTDLTTDPPATLDNTNCPSSTL